MGEITIDPNRNKILKATDEQLQDMLRYNLTIVATDILIEIEYRYRRKANENNRDNNRR